MEPLASPNPPASAQVEQTPGSPAADRPADRGQPGHLVLCSVVPALTLIALQFAANQDSLFDIVIDSIGGGGHRPDPK
jgi:hypothetical protein